MSACELDLRNKTCIFAESPVGFHFAQTAGPVLVRTSSVSVASPLHCAPLAVGSIHERSGERDSLAFEWKIHGTRLGANCREIAYWANNGRQSNCSHSRLEITTDVGTRHC